MRFRIFSMGFTVMTILFYLAAANSPLDASGKKSKKIVTPTSAEGTKGILTPSSVKETSGVAVPDFTKGAKVLAQKGLYKGPGGTIEVKGAIPGGAKVSDLAAKGIIIVTGKEGQTKIQDGVYTGPGGKKLRVTDGKMIIGPID